MFYVHLVSSTINWNRKIQLLNIDLFWLFVKIMYFMNFPWVTSRKIFQKYEFHDILGTRPCVSCFFLDFDPNFDEIRINYIFWSLSNVNLTDSVRSNYLSRLGERPFCSKIENRYFRVVNTTRAQVLPQY